MMRSFSLAGVLVSFVVLLACTSENSSGAAGQGGSGNSTAGDFCPRFMQGLCDHVALCGCDASAVQTCRNRIPSVCVDEYFSRIVRAVETGDVIYHPEAVTAALAPFTDPAASCSDMFIDLGWDSLEVQTFGNVFSGTHTLGSPCTVPSDFKGGVHDCQAGLFCSAQAAGEGRCVSLSGADKPCVLDGTGALCFVQRPPDRDNEYASAFASLECVPDAPGANTGTCQHNLANGQACGNNAVCSSGRCVQTGAGAGACATKANDGEACNTGDDCTSGGCSGATSPGICGAPLANGVSCGYDDASCASGSCYTPDNQTSSSSSGVCGPKLARAPGDACAQGYECASGTCRLDRCVEPICRRFL